MQKNLSAKLINMNTNYILSVKTKVLDGRIFITGKVDTTEEKIKNYKIRMGNKRRKISKK